MKCNNCGFERQEPFAFCPNCGAAAQKSEPTPPNNQYAAQPVSLNPAGDRVMGILKNGNFLAICILMTVCCALSFLSSGIPVINTLITIFLWLAYADAQKGFANDKHLRCVSGAVYANYVVTNVASIIVIVCGFLMGAAFAIMSSSELVEAFWSELDEELGGLFAFADISADIMPFLCFVISVALVVASVVVLVLNLIGMSKIHKFAKSVYMGIAYQNMFVENPVAAKNWLVVFGILDAVSAVTMLASDFATAIASGCSAAAAIMASVLIGKCFVSPTQYNQTL